jgi:hypothetical protein
MPTQHQTEFLADLLLGIVIGVALALALGEWLGGHGTIAGPAVIASPPSSVQPAHPYSDGKEKRHH